MAGRSSNHDHKFFHIVIVVLVLVAVFAFAKHYIRQSKWNYYVVQSQKEVSNFKNLDSVEDGKMISTTILNIPSGNPLINQPQNLQKYIEQISNQTMRDIVVVDTARKILADTVAANVDSEYHEDAQGEVAKTMGDGNPRFFVEKSADYPDGISQTVIPLKNENGATIGALILSTSTIFNK